MGNAASKNEIVVRNETTGELELIDLLTGQILSNNANPLPMTPYSFSYEKAIYICQLVKEGKTMKEISDMPDMPPEQVISHWQRTDRMFAEELKIARRERAEFYHDQAMTIAKTAAKGVHKDDVPALSLAAKVYQWGAEKAKPESYGNKVTHEGSVEKPILMRVINTGISRKPDVIATHTPEPVIEDIPEAITTTIIEEPTPRPVVEETTIEVTHVEPAKQKRSSRAKVAKDEDDQSVRTKRGRRSGAHADSGT